MVLQTSALDAHAQNKIFQTIDSVARGPGAGGEAPKVKTVLFITHRLSVARRADKIAMMEHGVCQIHPSFFDREVSHGSCFFFGTPAP